MQYIGLITVLAAIAGLSAPRIVRAETQETAPLPATAFEAAKAAPAPPETPLAKEYMKRLRAYLPYIKSNLHAWPSDPGSMYHKRDGSAEHDVRQNATIALGLAVIYAYGELGPESSAERQEVLNNARALVRYLCITHVANLKPTGDGKKWGDAWQSALWAAYAGEAAWFIWDSLDSQTREMAGRMIAHEADRFNTRPPDNGEMLDTKAEENGWNSEIPAIAACMFPNHPNAKIWDERAKVYMMNSFSTRADHNSTQVMDGRPVKDWVTTVCIHDDYTLENHRRVHPDYMSAVSLLLSNAIHYKRTGRSVPQACSFHIRDVFDVLKELTSTQGTFFYINGQDWWPHRPDGPLSSAGLTGCILGDPEGAFVESAALETLKVMHSRFKDGRAYEPREFSYPNAEEEMVARYADLYLAHRYFGDHPKPASREAFLKAHSGARVFESGGFVIDRTQGGFASFAWVNGAMGLLYPGEDTWFTSPDVHGLVGTVQVDGAKDSPAVVEAHTVTLTPVNAAKPTGFAFTGKLSRCEGKVEQMVSQTCLPDGTVVYIERIRALAPINVKEIATGTVSFLNEKADRLSSGHRRIWTEGKDITAVGLSEQAPARHLWNTDWLNVDNKLTMLATAPGQRSLWENHSFVRGRLQQDLAANYVSAPGPAKAGDILSQSEVVLIPVPRSRKVSMKAERIGDAAGVQYGEAIVAANFGDQPASASLFGQQFNIPPLTTIVGRAKEKTAGM